MLRISGLGWAKVEIDGEVLIEGSFWTDLPVDFLRAFCDYFGYEKIDKKEARYSTSVFVDGESEIANFLICDTVSYRSDNENFFMILQDKNGWHLKVFSIDLYKMANELILDIESDFENWVCWSQKTDDENLKIHRNNLMFWLNRLKSSIK